MQTTATTTAVSPAGPAAMTHPRGTSAAAGMLRRGAVLTALAAVLFPRLNAVLHEHQAFWQLDTEAAVLIPAIIAATVALFALVGRWAVHHHGAANRSAKAGLTCAILALVGVVAFFVSTPIIVGGLALTLGLEGKQRAALNGKRRHAIAAIALGALAVLAGAGIWLAGP